jgi:hypothetical protein
MSCNNAFTEPHDVTMSDLDLLNASVESSLIMVRKIGSGSLIALHQRQFPPEPLFGIGLDNQFSFLFFPYHCSAIRSSSIITPSSSSTLAVIAYVTCGHSTPRSTDRLR